MRYAIIEISTSVVLDVVGTRPTGLPDTQLSLPESDWAGDLVIAGWYWNGNRPATFQEVAPTPSDPPSNIDEAKARRDAAMAALIEANSAYDALLSAT